jgi:hypothetical protein
LTFEGEVEITPIAARPGDATVDELVMHYRALMGEHEDGHADREAMVTERRAVVRLNNRTYGTLDVPPRSGS